MSLIIKYPYIITDLDGTITRKDFTISDKTYEALRMYQLANDYKLILASGRLNLMTKEYTDKLQIKMTIISCNGALIRDRHYSRNFISKNSWPKNCFSNFNRWS